MTDKPPPKEDTPEAPWSPPSPPDDSPEWFQPLFVKFASVEWKSYKTYDEWGQVLTKWSDLEQSYRWKEEGAFPSANRPKDVLTWITIGRTQMKKCLSVKPTKTYMNAWWKWWMSLQPEWRGRGDRPLKWKLQDDWNSLKVPRKNGMTSVLAALFW
ncbi:hypothetical protein C8J56DRAFT_803682 [Mycena floridula]|nr:hypothetical protein C8J56DRAFT_803682 [Mycena floridula]